jgi:hypothetical protein
MTQSAIRQVLLRVFKDACDQAQASLGSASEGRETDWLRHYHMAQAHAFFTTARAANEYLENPERLER